MASSLLSYWLAALYLPHIKPWQFLQALQHFTDIESLFLANRRDLEMVGFSDLIINAIKHPNWSRVEADLRWQEDSNQHLVVFTDPHYPPLLKVCTDPPLLFYVKGDKTVLSCQQFAMVGTRHPSPFGVKNAQHFAAALAELGLVITSGLASGIDGACHQGALSVTGKTIAVCGTGLNTIYPTKHKQLAENIIASEGALISEFPLNTPIRGYNFPRRNRIISGMSIGVLVVEAAVRSGSLVTAQLALEQGRDVFAIPGNIYQPQYKGCHHLIKQGAILVETINDITSALPPGVTPQMGKDTIKKSSVMNSLAKGEQLVLEQIGYDITAFDMILLRSGLTTGELSSILLSLEMLGMIQVVSGGYVREITNSLGRCPNV